MEQNCLFLNVTDFFVLSLRFVAMYMFVSKLYRTLSPCFSCVFVLKTVVASLCSVCGYLKIKIK